MFRRTYYVQRAERRSEGEQVMRDTSFSSFMCILFIFILFTGLIVTAYYWRTIFLVKHEIEDFNTNDDNNYKLAESTKFLNYESAKGSTSETSTILTDREAEASEDVAVIFVSTTSRSTPPSSSTAPLTETKEETETTDLTSVPTSSETETESTTYNWYFTPSIRYDSIVTKFSDSETSETMSDAENTKTTDLKRDATISTSDLVDLDTSETENIVYVYGLTSLFRGRTTPFLVHTTQEEETTNEETETTDATTETNTDFTTTTEAMTETTDWKSNHDYRTNEQTTPFWMTTNQKTDTTESTETIDTTRTTGSINTINTFRPEQQYNELSKVKRPRVFGYDSRKDERATATTTETTQTTETLNDSSQSTTEHQRFERGFDVNDINNDVSYVEYQVDN